MRFVGLILTMFVFSPMCAQDIVSTLQEQKAGEGKVTIHHDARLETLLQGDLSTSEVTTEGDRRVVKTSGFRVQVYAGNNSRQARNDAVEMGEKVKEIMEDIPVYTHFVNPRWLCQVGDFRSIEEADVVMRKLKATGKFKEVSIIRGLINIAY